MRLAFSLVGLQLLLASSDAAFTFHSKASRSCSLRTLSHRLFAVDDRYSKLVENYQKRGPRINIDPPTTPTPIPDAAQPSIPSPPTVVPDDVSAVRSAAERVNKDLLKELTSQMNVELKKGAEEAATAAQSAVAQAETAASKAAAEAAASVPPPPPGKALLLSDYLKSGKPLEWQVGPDAGAITNAKDKLGVIKSNLGALRDSLGEVAEKSPITPAVKGAATGSTVELPGFSEFNSRVLEMVNNVADSLNLDSATVVKYGPWIAAAAAISLGVAQSNTARSKARAELAAELEEVKSSAVEAADAAVEAAEGAAKAKGLAKKIAKGASVPGLLEETKMRQLEVEKQAMKKELDNLRRETAQLRKQLSEALAETSSSAPQVKSDAVKAVTAKETMPRDPEEDSRILQVIKELDEENAATSGRKREPRAEEAEMAVSAIEMAAVEEEAAAMAAAAEEMASVAAAAEAKKAAKAAKEMAAVAAAEEAKNVAEAQTAFFAKVAAPAKAAPKKAAKKKVAKKKATKKAGAKKTAAKKKASPKKEPKIEVVPAKIQASPQIEVAAGTENPWASLSQSTLKRKTVAQLSEYLVERGVAVTDDSGKKLRKADLVSAVRSL